MAIARECFKDPVTTKYIMDRLCNIIRKEMRVLSSDDSNSAMKHQDMNAMKNFKYDSLLRELSEFTPNLLYILNSITRTKRKRQNQTAIICMCAAILTKHRYSKMSMFQKIISAILYCGHVSKQVHYY